MTDSQQRQKGYSKGYQKGDKGYPTPTLAPTAPACDDYLVVAGSSVQAFRMGVYVKTEMMQFGRPVYVRSGPEAQYLYFWELTGSWVIGTSYNEGYGGVAGTGADASSPVGVTTWYHVVDSSWEVAGGITVVANAAEIAAELANAAENAAELAKLQADVNRLELERAEDAAELAKMKA